MIEIDKIIGGVCDQCGGADDYNGYLAEKSDHEGNMTRYEHDMKGLEPCRMEAYGSAELRRTESEFLPGTRFPSVTTLSIPGASANLSPDSCIGASADWKAIKKTTRTYTADTPPWHLLESITESDPAGGGTRTTAYTYYPSGLRRSMDGPRTDNDDITYYEYHSVPSAR